MAGKAETELCFYGEVTNPAGFQQAIASEIQEQFEYRLPEDENGKRRGRQRVRKTTKDVQVAYTQTLKTPVEDGLVINGEIEDEIEITEDFYTTWRKTFVCTGVAKQRFVFLTQKVVLNFQGKTVELPEAKFEIDCFLNPEGRRSKFCKIDIEIQHLEDYLREYHPEIKDFRTLVKFDALPIGLKDVFPAVTEDPEEREMIKGFWKAFERKSEEGL